MKHLSKFIISVACSAIWSHKLAFAANATDDIGTYKPIEDVLICELASGDKFLLRATSMFSNNARYTPGHAAERINQAPYTAEFIKKGVSTSSIAPTWIPYKGKSKHVHENACGRVGVYNGIPLVPFSYLMANGRWFNIELIPEKLYLSPALKYQPPEIRQKLEELNISPDLRYAFVIPTQHELVYEAPLFRIIGEREVVTHVYKAFSVDQGKNWTNPIITDQSNLFDIGRSRLEQRFIARPGAANNGKRQNIR